MISQFGDPAQLVLEDLVSCSPGWVRTPKARAQKANPAPRERSRPMFKIGPVEDEYSTGRRHPGTASCRASSSKQDRDGFPSAQGAEPMDICKSECSDDGESGSPRSTLRGLSSPPSSPVREQVSPAASPKKSPYSAELRTNFAPFFPYSRAGRAGNLRSSKSYAVLPRGSPTGLRRSKSYSVESPSLPPLPPPVVPSVIDSYTPSALEFVLALEMDDAQSEQMASMPDDLWTPDVHMAAPLTVTTSRTSLPRSKSESRLVFRVNKQVPSMADSPDFWLPV